MTTVNALFGILLIGLLAITVVGVVSIVVEIIMLIREWRNDDLS